MRILIPLLAVLPLLAHGQMTTPTPTYFIQVDEVSRQYAVRPINPPPSTVFSSFEEAIKALQTAEGLTAQAETEIMLLDGQMQVIGTTNLCAATVDQLIIPKQDGTPCKP